MSDSSTFARGATEPDLGWLPAGPPAGDRSFERSATRFEPHPACHELGGSQLSEHRP